MKKWLCSYIFLSPLLLMARLDIMIKLDMRMYWQINILLGLIPTVQTANNIIYPISINNGSKNYLRRIGKRLYQIYLQQQFIYMSLRLVSIPCNLTYLVQHISCVVPAFATNPPYNDTNLNFTEKTLTIIMDKTLFFCLFYNQNTLSLPKK